ncbi:Probable malate dehydrogenase [Durusdinium trenchii]|uniref:Mitochondrial n=1 Tax=Durusdinium trenchii TaxID=1381693 RepID=A0ABP0QKE5_9DINO
MPNGYAVIANAALRRRLNLGAIPAGYANLDVSPVWSALVDNNIMDINFGGHSLLLADLGDVAHSTPAAEEDDAPLVRSVTCEKERGFVLDGAHYCIHCQRLANRATCIEKVKWWSDKIKLCEVLCEKAYAAARLAQAVLSGLAGERCAEPAFLKTDVCPGVDYFSSEVIFGPKGVEEVQALPKMTAKEKARLELAVKTLQEDIQEGLSYADTTELGRR